MKLSEIENYKTVLVTEKQVLSVQELNDRIKAINFILKQKNDLNESVIVFINDETFLIPVLWSLIKAGISCIPLNAAFSQSDIHALVKKYNVKLIITESKYVDSFPDLEVIAIDKEDLTVQFDSVADNTNKPFDQYIFPDLTNSQHSITLTDSDINSFFEELDSLELSPVHDTIMLSHCISYSKFLMELIWASTRGITVVVNSLEDPELIKRYLRNENKFKMDFGLFYFGSGEELSTKNKYDLLFDSVKFADKNDFISVWTPERHFNEFGGLFPNPSVLSAALAVSTSHVQIRSGSLVSPLHHPVRIAEDWALVDNLSGGRVAVSFASGWQCNDFIFAPENYSQRHEYMLGQIEKVKSLWKGEALAFKNGLGNEITVSIFPKPIQKELPVWVTVSGRTETFIDAGKIGANILTHLLWQDSDELIDKIAAYRKTLKENGFDPRSKKVSVMIHTYLGEDNIKVKDKVRGPLKDYIRTSTQLIQAMVKNETETSASGNVVGRYGGSYDEIPEHLMDELTEIAFNRFFEQAGLLGTIEKAVEMIKRLKKYDVDEIAALIDFGLGKKEILEGLVYLNELRKMFNGNNLTYYPVTVTHCSLKAIENAKTNKALNDLLSNQKLIMVQTDDFDKIPVNLLNKIKIMNENDDIKRNEKGAPVKNNILNTDVNFFETTICDEF